MAGPVVNLMPAFWQRANAESESYAITKWVVVAQFEIFGSAW
jgi:hypothetical protein